MYDTCLDVGSHLYYRSRGLSGAQLVRQGTLIDDSGIPIDSHKTEHCETDVPEAKSKRGHPTAAPSFVETYLCHTVS